MALISWIKFSLIAIQPAYLYLYNYPVHVSETQYFAFYKREISSKNAAGRLLLNRQHCRILSVAQPGQGNELRGTGHQPGSFRVFDSNFLSLECCQSIFSLASYFCLFFQSASSPLIHQWFQVFLQATKHL